MRGVLWQEPRQDALNRLRRRGDFEHAGAFSPKQLDAFLDGPQLTQHAATIAEQLVSPSRKEKPTTDAVEKLEATLVFEVADLPGQGGLADMHVQRRLRHGAQIGDGDECPHALHVHSTYLQFA
jgi:hypothetical protein